MKKLLFSLLAGLSLIGCIAPAEESENEIGPIGSGNNDDSYQYQNKNKGPSDCAPQFIELKTPDGKTVAIQIPALCDESPYVFKGDPSPDAVKRGEDVTNPGPMNEMIKHPETAPSPE